MGRPAVLKVDIIADARGVGAGVRAADKDLGGLAGTVRRHGRLIAVGLAGAAASAVALGKSSIAAASDLGETVSKTRVLFGQQSAAVEAFARTAGTAMGQSTQQALDAASTFATFGKAAGLSGKSLVGFSTRFTGLASDMASFSNTSPQEAIEAIGAALRGEAEPIRKYGVLLTESTLKTQALKLGLIQTTTQALTPQQKVLATQAAIYAQTTAAQGDFARTSGGLANQQRILGAQLDNLKAQLGTKLLPITVKITSAFVTLTAWLQRNRAVVVPVAAVIGTLAGAVFLVNKAAKAYAATQAALNVIMSLNPVGLVVIAIAALAAGVFLLWKRSETFRTGVRRLWDILRTFIGFSPFGLILEHLDEIWDKVKSVGDLLKNSPLGKLGGKAAGLLGLGAAGPLAVSAPRLYGGSPGYGAHVGRLSTAAAADTAWAGVLATVAGGALVLDQRDQRTSVRVDGALDPVSVASQVRQLLGAAEVRQGRSSAWGTPA